MAIRGTLQLQDYVTVLDAAPELVSLCGTTGHAHAGMLAAARGLVQPVLLALAVAVEQRGAAGWPVLLCGHSLGGGICSLLALLLEDLRALGEPRLAVLGPLRAIGIGAAAATCADLGEACRGRVTSLVLGADALPMFSVKGARMLIDDVGSASRVAALVSRLLSRRSRVERQLSREAVAAAATADDAMVGAAAGAAAAPEAATEGQQQDSPSAWRFCGIVCGSECSGLCGQAAPEDAALLASPALERQGSSAPLHRCPSTASTWSDASSVATTGVCEDAREGGVPMFPPGRLLWLLPKPLAPGKQQPAELPRLRPADQRQQVQLRKQPQHVVVEAQRRSLFRRFLLLPGTALHHVPAVYLHALHGLLQTQ